MRNSALRARCGVASASEVPALGGTESYSVLGVAAAVGGDRRSVDGGGLRNGLCVFADLCFGDFVAILTVEHGINSVAARMAVGSSLSASSGWKRATAICALASAESSSASSSAPRLPPPLPLTPLWAAPLGRRVRALAGVRRLRSSVCVARDRLCATVGVRLASAAAAAAAAAAEASFSLIRLWRRLRTPESVARIASRCTMSAAVSSATGGAVV
mmetsp:Transcript_24958/g.81756  ORF Transcript_24958/g.81756 Transcript_24958/m.81756 type:complete len:216 (+) Transcript_24958:63-710(+)